MAFATPDPDVTRLIEYWERVTRPIDSHARRDGRGLRRRRWSTGQCCVMEGCGVVCVHALPVDNDGDSVKPVTGEQLTHALRDTCQQAVLQAMMDIAVMRPAPPQPSASPASASIGSAVNALLKDNHELMEDVRQARSACVRERVVILLCLVVSALLAVTLLCMVYLHTSAHDVLMARVHDLEALLLESRRPSCVTATRSGEPAWAAWTAWCWKQVRALQNLVAEV